MHGVTESTGSAMVSWWHYVDTMLILRSTVKKNNHMIALWQLTPQKQTLTAQDDMYMVVARASMDAAQVGRYGRW